MRLVDADVVKEALRNRICEDIDECINNVPTVDVLDKIRAELYATAEMHDDGDYYLRDEWVDEIFDKYRGESDTDG